MTRRELLSSVLLLGFGVLVSLPAPAKDTVIPPKPSYQDEWMSTSTTEISASPFLELRNDQGPDTPERPVVPDSPTVDSGEETRDEDEPSDAESEEEPSGEADDQQETGETEPSQPDEDKQPTQKQQDTQQQEQTEPESEQTPDQPAERAEQTDEPTEETTEQSDEEPDDPLPEDLAGDVLSKANPLDTEGLRFRFDPSIESVTLHEIPLTMPAITAELSRPTSPSREPSDWWFIRRYRYWGFGGLVVLLITGMFFWFRQGRVTVLEREHPSTEDFFKNDEPAEPSGDARASPRDTESTAIETSVPESEPPDATEDDPEVSDPREPSESLVETLGEHGIQDEHKRLVEIYYDQGLSRREVAQQSDLGDGEVGLVLDLADRIKEEQAHGERA